MIAAWLDSLRAFAPAVLMAAPVLGAIVCCMVANARMAWSVSSALAILAAVSAFDLAGGGALSLAPFGLRVDAIAAVAAPIVAAAGAACVIGAGFLAPSDCGARAAPLALALVQIAWFGWIGATLANDLLAHFIFLSIASLAACGLCALGAARERAALSAAFRQLIWSGAAGVLFAAGAALAHRAAGSFDLAAISAAATQTEAPRSLAGGFALMIAALCVLGGAAPLGSWNAAAYGRGARLASLALASVGAVAVLAVLMRLSLAAAVSEASLARGVSVGLATLGAASVAIGSLQAIGAQDVRRLAAYAGAAQIGAALIALALGTPSGHAAAAMQMAAMAVIALGLLGGAAVIDERAPLSRLDGFGKRAPLAGAAMAVGALGLVGAPLTLGFLSRWRLIEATLGHGWWWAAGVIIAASLAAVFYAGRVIERLYVRSGPPETEERAAWRLSLAPAHVLAIAATIGLGLNASALWRAASLAGELLGGTGRP